MATNRDIDRAARLEAECAELRRRLAVLGEITGREGAEALAASEARFREIFAESPIAIETYDAQGHLLDVNRACLDLFGVVDPAEVRGFRLFEDPNLPADAKEHLARDGTVRFESVFDFEKVKRNALYRTTRSGVMHLEVSIARLGAPAAPSGYIVQVLNSTERKQAEEALRESETRYKLLFDAIPESVLLIGTDGCVITANRASARLYGYDSPEQLEGVPTPLLIAEKDRQRARKAQAEVIQGREAPTQQYTEVRRDGSEFIAEVRSTILRGPGREVTGYIGITRDITERVRTEEALRRSEAKLRAVVESSREGIVFADASAKISYRCPACARIDGFSDAERLGRDSFEIAHPEDRPALREIWSEAVRLPGAVRQAEYRIRHKDGTWRWVESTIYNLLEHPDLGEMVVTARDCTERRQAEQALQESNARYRVLVESSVLGIGISRGERVVYANPALLDMLGHSGLEEMQRAPLLAHVAEGSRQLVQERMAARERGEAPAPRWEYRGVRTDGTVRDIEAVSTTISIDGEAHTLTIFRDITELKNAEEEKARLREQLSHAQKMEAIGALAGGVAHDFNNFLGGVLSGLSVLELELGDVGDRHRAQLRDLKNLVRSGAGLSQQLLGFSRRGKYDVAPRDVRKVVQTTADLFARTRRDITLALDLVPDLDWALVDHAQLEQVLLNLFINAAHAMPDGGRLTIRGDNATLTAAEAEPHGASPGRFVRLVVADTGTGIDPAILPRIFEPFFTTKPSGHGSGLGLASVYGIVKNHGGVITVESELGKGAAFTVLLPATGQPSADRPASQATASPGHGTILVVDDDERMLRSMSRLLGAMGYEVLTAPGGRAAVDLVRQHRERISLVILDMTMPEMSGAATFDAIRKILPTLKVLLSSGFSIDGQAQALLDRGCNGFIQKPFDEVMLSEKIQALR